MLPLLDSAPFLFEPEVRRKYFFILKKEWPQRQHQPTCGDVIEILTGFFRVHEDIDATLKAVEGSPVQRREPVVVQHEVF